MSTRKNSDTTRALAEHSRIMSAIYDRINNVHKRPLHAGQIQVAKAYFNDNKRIIQSQWGRNAGKSETVLFVSNVRAILVPNSQIYIICPERKQGKEIYWASRRLQNYAPPEFISEYHSTDLRITFKNGSFICIDGCENLAGLAGIKPHLVFYDEFQRHSQEFDLEIMRPNLLAKNSSLIVTGTPPKRDCYYVQFKKQLLEEIKNGDDTRLYLQFPTSINPTIDAVELQKTIDGLIRSGNQPIARREYYGEDCFGGEGVVFPFWSRQEHLKPHGVLLSFIERDKSKLRWLAFADPGAATCFAVLFVAYNPYTQQIFVLDEIHETDRKQTEPLRMWHRIEAKQRELFDGRWTNGYDSAEAWWRELVQTNFKVPLVQSEKNSRLIEDDIAIMKSIMAAQDSFHVSDRCTHLVHEIENYVTDESGSLPDGGDHLLDCFRYILRHVNYQFIERVDAQRQNLEERQYLIDGVKAEHRESLLDWDEDLLINSLNAESWDTILQ